MQNLRIKSEDWNVFKSIKNKVLTLTYFLMFLNASQGPHCVPLFSMILFFFNLNSFYHTNANKQKIALNGCK